MKIHKLSILIVFLLAPFIALSADPEVALDEFIRTGMLNKGTVAVKIIDLSDHSTIVSHNSDLPLVPASIMKAVTTAALFSEAGPDYTYHTTACIDGPVDLGTLRGNLIIIGNCDPSLHSQYEPYGTDFIAEIAEALKRNNISQIEGKIIIDQSSFRGASRPDSWAKADFRKYYGTGSHSFNFSNNATGDDAIENPSAVFIKLLSETLAANGITIENRELGEGRRLEICDHISPELDEIMRSCMMRSDNLFAECMLRTYGKIKGADGSTQEAATIEMNKWRAENYPIDGVMIVDGSGLSRNNRVTADFMSAVLSSMSSDPVYASFFPLAGQEGTMKKFLAGTELDSYLAMKTGSMTGIQCYAGYKLDDNYEPTHVVVIILNEVKNKDKAKKAAQKLMLDIFAS